MFEGPKKIEKEDNLKEMVKLAGSTLEREVDSEVEPRKMGGYLLNTKMALMLSLGLFAFSGEVEGQVSTGKSYHPKGPGRQITEQIVKDVMFETHVSISNSQGKREMRVMDEYVRADSELANQEIDIDTRYGTEEARARQDKDTLRLQTLIQEHRQKKMEIAHARANLRRKYDVRQGGIRATTGVVGAVLGELGRRF